jgi:hydroxymethylbilane synthase
MTDAPLLRLGTRGSPLALIQANMVAAALTAAHNWGDGAIEIVPVKTTGDRVQDRPLAEIGGKALWTKELDAALLGRRIDIAVHSMKDVETWRPDSLVIAAMLPRADVRDRLIGADSIGALARGAHVGTSSPRRAAQLLRLRPDLRISSLRGNVATRLARLAAGEVDATLLAAAGLDRLGQAEVGTVIPVERMLPAPSQGAVGIEARRDDARMLELLGPIDHLPTSEAVFAERALLDALGGTCHTPMAALAVPAGDLLQLSAEILSPDGRERHGASAGFAAADRSEATRALAAVLMKEASPSLRALFGPR